MTQKEEIEKMVKILSGYEINELMDEKDLAEYLYNAGYRKVNADGNAYNMAKTILTDLLAEAEGMNNKTVELSAYYIKNTLAKAYGVEL